MEQQQPDWSQAPERAQLATPLSADVREAIEMAARVMAYAADGLRCDDYDQSDMKRAARTIYVWLDQ